MYEMFEKLLEVCNEVRDDMKKRLVENPDIVEMQENGWMYEMISNIPSSEKIKALDSMLSRFDRETKYNQNK